MSMIFRNRLISNNVCVFNVYILNHGSISRWLNDRLCAHMDPNPTKKLHLKPFLDVIMGSLKDVQ